VHARALVAGLPESIAWRELNTIKERLGLDHGSCRAETIHTSVGPGNVLMIVIDGDSFSEIVTGFGLKGITAEKVASDACAEAEAYLAAGVPVGIHLADQLLVPVALAGGGTFRSLKPTAHTVTNAEVIRAFLDVPIAIEHERGEVYRVRVGSTAEGNAV